MARTRPLFEGKAKVFYEGPDPDSFILYFKDNAATDHHPADGEVSGKGVLNNRISEFAMLRLAEVGIPNHFIRRLNMREQVVRSLEMIPVQVVVRNLVAGSLARRLGLDEGTKLDRPLIEWHYKNNPQGDPLVSEDHIIAFSWASPHELEEMMNQALRINDVLFGLFSGAGLRLVDFKIEFGRLDKDDRTEVVLGDEISADSCRVWFRSKDGPLVRPLPGVERYQIIAERLGLHQARKDKDPETNVIRLGGS